MLHTALPDRKTGRSYDRIRKFLAESNNEKIEEPRFIKMQSMKIGFPDVQSGIGNLNPSMPKSKRSNCGCRDVRREPIINSKNAGKNAKKTNLIDTEDVGGLLERLRQDLKRLKGMGRPKIEMAAQGGMDKGIKSDRPNVLRKSKIQNVNETAEKVPCNSIIEDKENFNGGGNIDTETKISSGKSQTPTANSVEEDKNCEWLKHVDFKGFCQVWCGLQELKMAIQGIYSQLNERSDFRRRVWEVETISREVSLQRDIERLQRENEDHRNSKAGLEQEVKTLKLDNESLKAKLQRMEQKQEVTRKELRDWQTEYAEEVQFAMERESKVKAKLLEQRKRRMEAEEKLQALKPTVERYIHVINGHSVKTEIKANMEIAETCYTKNAAQSDKENLRPLSDMLHCQSSKIK